jgi:hypothetical protein
MKSSIFVPTFCGKDVLQYFFESVEKYNVNPDLFLFVVKPCPDSSRESLELLENQKKKIKNIYIVKYNGTYGLIKQILIGLHLLYQLGIDVVIFADDDSYFVTNGFVEKHVIYYNNANIGGVAGRIVNVIRDEKGNFKSHDKLMDSNVIPPKNIVLWRKPSLYFTFKDITIPYQTYFTKGGYVNRWGNDEYYIKRGYRLVPSLLGGGPNMSIRLSAIRELLEAGIELLPNTTVGMRYEQILAYHIVKKGFLIIKDYDIVVYHIFRNYGETRSPRPSRRSILTAVDEFIYYYMKNFYNSDFSIMYKLIGILQRFIRHVFIEPRSPEAGCKLETLIGRIIGQIAGNLFGFWYLSTSNKDYIYTLLLNLERNIRFLDNCMKYQQ